jgi:3-oxoacyl-[acyl-carrier protein] reductase
MSRLTDDVILVTGASRGLGRSMSVRFAEAGANVVLVARDESALDAVAEETATESLVAPGDVTDLDAMEEVVAAAHDRFGGVDTLVNNAGIGLLSMEDGGAPLADVDADRWRQIIDVNLTGVFNCSKAALPGMVEQGHGNVINISSGLGRRAAPGYSPYIASKFGLEGLTKTTAMDYEDDGINVNALDPGGRVNTAFWDHLPEDERQSILQPDVMDEAAVRLAAQGPEGVTGESLPADEWEERLG